MCDLSPSDARSAGRWTKQEHERFLAGLELYGKDWKKIEALVGTRTGAQIRSHAQKYFIRKGKDQGDSTEEADEMATPVTPCSISPPIEGFSYYLAKIVGKYSIDEDFDFWGHLIDHKSHLEMERPARKGSFVTTSSESVNEYERTPFKRVKREESLIPSI